MVTLGLLLVVGLALLILGAEIMVYNGMRIAARLGVPPVVIGLTIVAIGTSAPELAVGIDASLQGNGGLAVGNITGTNVVNILLILGLSALISPLALRLETLKLDLPAIVATSALLLALSWDGSLSRYDGVFMVILACGYTVGVIILAQRESRAVRVSVVKELGVRSPPKTIWSLVYEWIGLIAGIAIIVYGADLLVDGAVGLARVWGLSDAFVGLTIVAIGTSAPELVTTVISTFRNKRDIAVGNLIGSSVYNILFILGLTCAVTPSAIAVSTTLLTVDIPILVAVALICVPVFISGRQVSRIEGGAFVTAYVVYLAYLVVTRT